MNYKERFIAAVNKTKELHIGSVEKVLPLGKSLSEKKKIQILNLCHEALLHQGFNQSSDLAKQCVPVHMMLQQILSDHLNIKSHITIGDKYWSDYIYCETSYDYITNEYSEPNEHSPLQAHVWLTLSDGTILDCTGEAHADMLMGRGEHPTHQCLSYIKPTENIADGYHRPYIVGSEFLYKTGSFAIHVAYNK